ncbi:MAG: hypothetical protein ACOC5J_00515 [Gemmatimonadota bacterium]
MRPRRPYYIRKNRRDPYAGEIASWVEPAARTAYLAKGVAYGALCALEAVVLFGSGRSTVSLSGTASLLTAFPGTEFLHRSLLWTAAGALALYVVWRFAQGMLDPEGRGSGGWALSVRAACLVSGGLYGWLAFALLEVTLGASPSEVAAVAVGLDALAGPEGSGWLASLLIGAVAVRGVAEIYLAMKPHLPQEIRLAGLRGRSVDRVLVVGRTALVLRGGSVALLGAVLLVTSPPGGPALESAAIWLLEVLVGADHAWLLATLVSCAAVYAAYQLVKARYRLIGEY